MSNLRDNLIGDRAFYRRVLRITLPVIVQNGLTNIVNLLDNVMVGRLGTEEMLAPSVVNQLMIVFNITLFGALSGIGIFATQFFGRGDDEGVRQAFRAKLLVALFVLGAGLGIFAIAGDSLIGLYLHDDGSGINVAAAFAYAERYLKVMMIGLVPYAITQVYSSTLREKGESVIPMLSGGTAILINLLFNYILIYGKFGAPALGVTGAAIATSLSRFVECAIVVLYTHIKREKCRYICGVYRSLYIPRRLALNMLKRTVPLLANELIWSLSVTAITQSYSVRGATAIAALNISTTIANLFNTVFMGIGSGVSIIVGQQLGGGHYREAKRDGWRALALSFSVCLVIGGAMAAMAGLFPNIYNTSPEIRALAANLIRVASAVMPFAAFVHASYFIIRSGGRTVITFFFDAAFIVSVSLPTAFILSRYTALPLVAVYAIVSGIDIIKCIIAFFMIKSGIWLNTISADGEKAKKEKTEEIPA